MDDDLRNWLVFMERPLATRAARRQPKSSVSLSAHISGRTPP
jgi:hypothetical protein